MLTQFPTAYYFIVPPSKIQPQFIIHNNLSQPPPKLPNRLLILLKNHFPNPITQLNELLNLLQDLLPIYSLPYPPQVVHPLLHIPQRISDSYIVLANKSISNQIQVSTLIKFLLF